MNQLALDLNNHAIADLQAGNIVKAFELLSKASKITMSGVANHAHIDTASTTYQFHWEDCHSILSLRSFSSRVVAFEGSTPFLFMRALRVTTPFRQDINRLCPCGFAWVVWYNLALCCSLIGTRLGEKGILLLRTAFDLYQKVQRRIDREPPSKHWSILQMAVINNQACIYRDFGMREGEEERLEKLAIALLKSCDSKGVDWDGFFLNLQILGRSSLASAA